MSGLRTNVAHQRLAHSVIPSFYSQLMHRAAILEDDHGLMRLPRASEIKIHRETFQRKVRERHRGRLSMCVVCDRLDCFGDLNISRSLFCELAANGGAG